MEQYCSKQDAIREKANNYAGKTSVRERENVWEYVRTEVWEKEKKCKIIIINSLQG